MLLGVDVGGTFTDAALLDGDRLHTAKVPSTPEDQSRGVIDAVDQVLGRAGAGPADVAGFTHGMTVGTNALLEERGARTALVATRGFGDLLDIGRQNRPSLYHPCRGRPRSLVEVGDRVEAAERVGASGVIEELADEEVERLVEALRGSGAESIAVCLLFAFSDPSHERRIATALRQALPEVHVSASHEVLPAFREYERFSTTVIDAYLSPLLGRYLTSLAGACHERGLPEPVVMRSSGGTAEAAEAARAGAWSVLSGPAGGAVGAALLAQGGGHPRRDRARHGRHVLRRLRGRRRRGAPNRLPRDRWPPDPAADGRRAHGRRRRRLDRLAGLGRGASRRPTLGRGRARARLLRPRRHRADGHRRQPAARLPLARLAARRRRRPGSRSPRAAASPSWARASDSRKSRRPRGSSG